MIRVCIAGATGWAGSELARAVAAADDLALVSAVSRTHAGQTLGQALAKPGLDTPVFGSIAEALSVPCDVLVEYTKPESAKGNIIAALERGCHVVVGTSGLNETDFSDIEAVAERAGHAVLACGNFALTVVLLQRFALKAAKLIPQWEIIDYASDTKRDAPSGTALELALQLSKARTPSPTVPLDQTTGLPHARGATASGSQVHSVRLPGYVIGAEIIFGMSDQRLTIRHDAGNSALPYVDGALLAIRRVATLSGVHWGLDAVLNDGG